MARKRFNSTPESIARRIAQGYGQGTGPNYRPWLEVQDFPSRGVVHRPLGCKTGRVHQCFSDLEHKAFLIYDIARCITDIREQFPLLPLEETLEIADRLGVRHPRDPATKYPVVMTTDFLLKLDRQCESPFHARTAKYAKDLEEQRIRDYFKIEHCYWLRREIDWGYFTEKDIPRVLAANAALIHPFHLISDLHPLNAKDVRAIASYLLERIKEEQSPLIKLVSDSDQKFSLPVGKSFGVVCHLIARNVWTVDLDKPIDMNGKLFLL